MIEERSFYDFAPSVPGLWRDQMKAHSNVQVYFDKKNNAWCRRIDKVRCERIGDEWKPLPGQLVNYSQSV